METMGWMERLVVNHPLRAWFQRREVAYFRRHVSLPADGLILEIGCGRGAGARHLQRAFRPRSLVTFDLDLWEVDLARRYLRFHGADGVHLLAADATHLPFPDGAFDGVFETGVLHHIPDWPAALREVGRVLKPDGLFCFLDISRRRLRRPLFQFFLPHAGRGFSRQALREELARAGLPWEAAPWPRPPFFDLAGIARKAA